MLALGILTWFFVGRRALKRIDNVSLSSRRILSGDRSERLPVTGAGDEFDRLSKNLNHMLDRIGRLDDGLKQMSDNIAHDLKTPITRLRNKADEALAISGDEEGRTEILSEIISDCDQIVKTFDALLMISRVESGSAVARRETLNVKELLSDVFELYEAVAEERYTELMLDVSDQSLTLHGNRELLSQALSNLMENAFKYASDGTDKVCITIGAEETESGLSLFVSDNGSGISLDEREKVIERFARLDKSRNKPGNGLGLALVKAIAEMHDGALVLEDNEPGLRAILAIDSSEQ